MEFVATIADYAHDQATQRVWAWLKAGIGDVDGLTYYRAPLFGTLNEPLADLTVFSANFNPIVLKVADWVLDEIAPDGDDKWIVTRGDQRTSITSPFLEIDEFRHKLQAKFDQDRKTRGRFSVKAHVVLPAIQSKGDFYAKFGGLQGIIWDETQIKGILSPLTPELSKDEFRLALANIQGARPLNSRYAGTAPSAILTMADAIHYLERNIACLDKEQIKVAHQVPPGPQRIRGLAGTGKTVLLAMKAANLHARYPNKNVLYTFHTQSLYNHVRNLISLFYRDLAGIDPDWGILNIRHSWGGRANAGVYSDLCKRVGAKPLDFTNARFTHPASPFTACCEHALSLNIQPQYDFILIDEAQDFPADFFKVAWRLCKPLTPEQASRPIYWAYDELQSLSNLEMPNVIKQFGLNESGNPVVTLDGEAYPGEIEKDFVLHRAYRCPHRILMVAHAIGLGIKNTRGPVQMLGDADSWRSIGYQIESGQLKAGEDVVILRPPENSPNPLSTLESTVEELLVHRAFDSRDEELAAVAKSIKDDIEVQGVRPEQILVISLDALRARQNLASLQSLLSAAGIASMIPGLVDSSWEFTEVGRITLSTVYRAKGNEAPVVYILASEKLYDYVGEVENRNRVFTAMSRSKGWVRMSGVGTGMKRLEEEIAAIEADFPRFRFTFPNMDTIRKLDAETAFRKREMRRAREAVRSLQSVDADAISGLDQQSQRILLEKALEAIVKGGNTKLSHAAGDLWESIKKDDAE
jgi:superfamily I DNA and RNA helicase